MQADFVIIGAGSAGCVLAARLSEDAKHSVAVIEYGGTDWGPLIQMPAALSYPMNMSHYDWGYRTEPEPYLGGRILTAPRGKVIGGSSSINGMVYVRGHALDYDYWHAAGATGWSYADVLPYFKRMETWHGDEVEDQEHYRGTGGPLHIRRGKRNNPLFNAFIKAGEQAGYGVTDDYNGARQEGFAAMEQTIYKGRRWSAASAYLYPALRRQNCTLIRGFARKIMLKNKQATGVEIERNNKIEVITARREVIIAASVFNTPKLLMLSGIGNAAELAKHGIDVVNHRVGVGQNLQDHLEIYFQVACLQPITLYKHWNFFSKMIIGAQWLLTKSGLGASNHMEATGFIRSTAGVAYPDIQYHFLPIAVRYDGKMLTKCHGFQAHVGPMRSLSRGVVRLQSNDPKVVPKILFNYMSHEKDWKDFKICIKLTRQIFKQSALKPYSGAPIQPSSNVCSDADLEEFIRSEAESAYHPCGTCKMGAVDDKTAVVDPECRVIGVKRLRVADSSIFPRITNGNLNAPSIMTGEKAADHILGKQLLPKSNLRPWIHPQYKTRQR